MRRALIVPSRVRRACPWGGLWEMSASGERMTRRRRGLSRAEAPRVGAYDRPFGFLHLVPPRELLPDGLLRSLSTYHRDRFAPCVDSTSPGAQPSPLRPRCARRGRTIVLPIHCPVASRPFRRGPGRYRALYGGGGGGVDARVRGMSDRYLSKSTTMTSSRGYTDSIAGHGRRPRAEARALSTCSGVGRSKTSLPKK